MTHPAPRNGEKASAPFAKLLTRLLLLLSLLNLPGLADAQLPGYGGSQQDQNQNQQNPQNPYPQGGGGTTGATSSLPPYTRPRPLITNVPDPGALGLPTSQQQTLIPAPYEPDIEFQRYVASSLGYRLAIFGQNLFENVPSTFAPLDYIPVTPDYLIGPGDQLLIRGWGQIDIENVSPTVDRNGSIFIPSVGTISVAGMRYDRLRDYLKREIGRYYKNFDLDVTLGQLRSIQIFVVGQVKRPGTYTISSLSTLVNAIFACGGPAKRGSMRRIELRRGGELITTFDLYDLIIKGDKSKDVHLQPGDVLSVPAVGPLVAMAGSLNVPAIYEMSDHDTLGDVMGYAGGLSSTAAGQQATLERIADRQERKAVDLPLTPEGLRQDLHNGDIVRFLHISLRFDNAVTLRGNVAVPGRYPWREGMRVKDLIPNREFLIPEEYWKEQNLLGLSPGNESYLTEEQREEAAWRAQQNAQLQAQRAAAQAGLAAQPGQAAQAAQGQTAPSGTQQPTPYSPYTGIIPGELSPADVAAAQAANADLTGGGANMVAPAQPVQPGQTSTAAAQNLQETVGRLEAQRINQEALQSQIKRSSSEINWQYALIQRLDPKTLTSQLLTFNLGKAIEGDETENKVLQPGDTIVIFSQASMEVPLDKQTKFIRLEGEFLTPGVYQAEPGETLRHLVTRVTGLTPKAYLFGSEFTRESVRENLQLQLDNYVGGLQAAVASVQPQTTQQAASLAAQRGTVQRMSQLRSTGRIVLEVKPDANSVDDLPDLALEDGDRLFVPARPVTVSVVGTVYNSSAFSWRRGFTVADYLRLAGGPTKAGDKKQEFVLRANGAAVSRAQHSKLVMNNFATLQLQPGDTVIVPPKPPSGQSLQQFLVWAQLFSSFALGAAGLVAALHPGS